MPRPAFRDVLGTRVLVLDGGMGTSTYNYELSVEGDYANCENCTDILSRTRPELVEEIHRSFFESGSDAVETNTFGTPIHVLDEFDLGASSFELSKQSAEIARAAADAYSTEDKPRFVLGSMGPGTKLITLGQITWERMLASYREAMRGLIAGGADAILIETCQDLLQVKCAVNAALAALDDQGKCPEDIPLMGSITIEQMGTMLVGSSLEAAVTALRDYPIASIGLNCATGPVEMGEHIKYLAKAWDRAISCYPNAGLPVLEDGETVYPLGPDPMAESLKQFVTEYGVSVVGGCCGTPPAHHKAKAETVGGLTPARKETIKDGDPARAAASASLFTPVPHRQDATFLIVGERCNASGSRKFKRLLEEEDWDSIVSLAREQVRDGSHVLDVNVDYAGRDNARDMAEVVKRLVRQVDAPLMIDSTQTATIESGLRHAGGKCIINSANFEDGDDKFDQICRLATTYNAALVIGTIDEDPEAAMARTADRKLSIAERAIERAINVHGISAEDIFIDPLVLPISTGMDSDRRSALELVEGTRRIAESFPTVQITCGLSNVSFGLKPAARVVLNSVLMHELTAAGMSSAIVHASKILPLNKIDEKHKSAALDLIYDRRSESNGGTGLPEGVTDSDYDPLQALIDLFKDVNDVAGAKKEKKNLTLEERLREHIIDGEKEGLAESLATAMEKYAPLDIINDHLLDGMKTVGELFGSGQMQLPFVLQSAEVMKKAVAHLEPHMERVEGQTKGTIVLATVKGDVHDIGKNLVDIILTNNGYTVHNIGIKIPINEIVAKYRETKPDAIGLSGLLVKSVNVMEENLKELNNLGITVPMILGGAALQRSYCEGHLRDTYHGKTYHGTDAFEGLRLMDYVCANRFDELEAEIEERKTKRATKDEKVAELQARSDERKAADGTATATLPARSDTAILDEVPAPPFYGSRVVEGLDLDQIYPYINETALFKTQWQFTRGSKKSADYDAQLEDEVRPILDRYKRDMKEQNVLQGKVVYGFWPCNADGDDLVIYDPEDHDKEIERFTNFPRQHERKRLCISDFFLPVDSGRKDVLPLQCVTMGQEISRVAKEYFDADNYTEYLYAHGMGVECAEALAELWHKRIRVELGIGNDDSPKIKQLFTQKYRGSRYSFGYPSCPEMQDQEILIRLLEPERIGCELTENWQIDPEQSTSAIVVHHPDAKYFNL